MSWIANFILILFVINELGQGDEISIFNGSKGALFQRGVLFRGWALLRKYGTIIDNKSTNAQHPKCILGELFKICARFLFSIFYNGYKVIKQKL